MEENKTYMVKAALVEDINSPYIWFSSLSCESRDIVKLTNTDENKSIWCEVVKASENYVDRYNKNKRTINIVDAEPCLVANEWYREKLGLSKNSKSNIRISVSRLPLFYRQLLASYKHPDNTVRLAVDLALVSVILGGVGLVLGVVSLCK
jgi:hypothetical protein